MDISSLLFVLMRMARKQNRFNSIVNRSNQRDVVNTYLYTITNKLLILLSIFVFLINRRIIIIISSFFLLLNIIIKSGGSLLLERRRLFLLLHGNR